MARPEVQELLSRTVWAESFGSTPGPRRGGQGTGPDAEGPRKTMIMARNRCYLPETGHDHEAPGRVGFAAIRGRLLRVVQRPGRPRRLGADGEGVLAADAVDVAGRGEAAHGPGLIHVAGGEPERPAAVGDREDLLVFTSLQHASDT